MIRYEVPVRIWAGVRDKSGKTTHGYGATRNTWSGPDDATVTLRIDVAGDLPTDLPQGFWINENDAVTLATVQRWWEEVSTRFPPDEPWTLTLRSPLIDAGGMKWDRVKLWTWVEVSA